MYQALHPGDAIHFVSAASPVTREAVEDGLGLMKDLGYLCRFGEFTFGDNGLTAATPAERIADLYAAGADPQVRLTWGLRGGYGTIQMLAEIDYRRLAQNYRPLVGFSDLTALQWGIFAAAGLPSLSGLTLTTQVSHANPYLGVGLEILSGRRNYYRESDFRPAALQVRRPGEAEGILLGGNLAMIGALAGTPFFVERDDLILFIEDVDEPLYRLDRLFYQLALMGVWARVRGVILGRFTYKDGELDPWPNLAPLIPEGVPVVSGVPYGHTPDCAPMPIGVAARLQTAPFRLEWDAFLA